MAAAWGLGRKERCLSRHRRPSVSAICFDASRGGVGRGLLESGRRWQGVARICRTFQEWFVGNIRRRAECVAWPQQRNLERQRLPTI
eukprot:scaffold1791_cov143-Isochrysis_galbana.AAC.2